MKVTQFPYLSPEAMALRRRDGTAPWDVHPCEVDSFDDSVSRPGVFQDALLAARQLRDELEKR